jgi:hypothetical protein
MGWREVQAEGCQQCSAAENNEERINKVSVGHAQSIALLSIKSGCWD